MQAFTHILLTRFNVKIAYGEKVGFEPNTAPDQDWLTHRFKLFDTFCFPSVYSQTIQNFKWLLLFDSNTPDSFREKIKSYAKWCNFIPHYVDSYSEFMNQNFDQILSQYIHPESRHLITTRLDNDDGIGLEFVETIQRNFQNQDFEFINLTNGYLFNNRNRKLYIMKHFTNPFVSLIELCNNPRTVLRVNHNKLYQIGKVRQVETKPLWIQVIHERNVANKAGYWKRVALKNLTNEFNTNYDLPLDSDPESLMTVENFLNMAIFWIINGLKSLRRR